MESKHIINRGRVARAALGLLAVTGCSSSIVTGNPFAIDAGVDGTVVGRDIPLGLPDVPTGPDAPLPPVDVPPAVDVPPGVDAPKVLDVAPPVDAPTSACHSDRDCTALGLVCDLASSTCVDCARDADCLAPGTVCRGNHCVTPVGCTSSRTCPGQVCDLTLMQCVDCVANTDCTGSQVCRASVCVAGPTRCAAAADCTAAAPVCNTTTGECVRCLAGTDCPSGEQCFANACVVCIPGAASCASGATRSVCSADGRTLSTASCPAGANQTAACTGAGVCTATCAAGFFDCDGAAANGCESATTCPSRLIGGLGGPTGYGLAENCLHANDDGSYSGPSNDGGVVGSAAVAIPLTTAFPMGLNFFGHTYSALYVNTNGNVTFNASLPTYTPDPFPISSQPMIAPWWADVDTRGGGQPTNNSICFAQSAGRFIVTWSNVGYFSMHNDRLNAFQLVLVDRSSVNPGDFDVEFRYDRCEWETGDASGGSGGFGGTPAQVGFDAGDRTHYLALSASRTPAIINVCSSTNVTGGPPGIWRYLVRGGVVTSM